MLTVKSVVLVAVPPGVVTVIFPVVAPVGTVAVICVAEFTVNVAVTPLNLTEVVVKPVPLKFVPVITTVLPTGPKVGVNEVIVGRGAAFTVKLVALIPVPLEVVTLIGPLVAPVGTVVTICVAVLEVIVAVTPLNFTEVAPERFVPVIVTVVPTDAEVGEKDVIVGHDVEVTVKVPELWAEGPSLFVTVSFPVTAPLGTAARTWVLESIKTVVWSTGVMVSAPKVTLVTLGLVKPVPVIVT